MEMKNDGKSGAFRACLHPQAAALLESAAQAPEEITQDGLANEETKQLSVAMFHALTMTMTGSPALMLRSLPMGAGFEAWRQLHVRYAGKTRGRQYALLSRVLRPAPFGKKANEFESALVTWEQEVRAYEVASGETMSRMIMMQV